MEIRGRDGVAADAVAGHLDGSKLAIVCGLSSSKIWKSAAVRPVTGTPFLSVTTTSTVTCSTSAGKRGASAAAVSAEPATGTARAPARPGRAGSEDGEDECEEGLGIIIIIVS